jgi:hypothetical protein
MPEEKIEVFQFLTLLPAPAGSTTVKFSDSLPSRHSVPPCRRGGGLRSARAAANWQFCIRRPPAG